MAGMAISRRKTLRAGIHHACARHTDTTASEKSPNVGTRSVGRGSSPTPSTNNAFNARISHQAAEKMALTSKAGALSIRVPLFVVKKVSVTTGTVNIASKCPTGACIVAFMAHMIDIMLATAHNDDTVLCNADTAAELMLFELEMLLVMLPLLLPVVLVLLPPRAMWTSLTKEDNRNVTHKMTLEASAAQYIP